MDSTKNFAKVTVSTGYNNAAVSIVLNAGQGALLPAVPFNATWWNSTDYSDPTDDPLVEIVRVTVNSSDTLTITRAQEGTSASNHNVAGKTYKMIAGMTSKTITDIQTLLGEQITTLAGPFLTITDTIGQRTVLSNYASGVPTITLPTAVGNTAIINIKKVDSSGNSVLITTTGGQTIDGGSSASLKVQFSTISLISDGSNWNVV